MTAAWTYQTETYRYATREDLPAFVKLFSDLEVTRWLWFAPLPAEAVAQYFGPFLDTQVELLGTGSVPETAVIAVEDLRGEFLGHGAVVAVEGSPGGFEVGFQLMRHACGRGVGTRLGRFLCAYALELCQAYRIEAACLEGNSTSAALIRKLGLVLEGSRPGYRLKGDVRHTELCFGIEVERLDAGLYAAIATQVGLRE